MSKEPNFYQRQIMERIDVGFSDLVKVWDDADRANAQIRYLLETLGSLEEPEEPDALRGVQDYLADSRQNLKEGRGSTALKCCFGAFQKWIAWRRLEADPKD